MKTKVVKYKGGLCWGTATVEYIPNRLEKLFGVKSKTKKYKWEGTTYWIDGMKIWFDKETGKEYGRFGKIDNFIRKEKYKE